MCHYLNMNKIEFCQRGRIFTNSLTREQKRALQGERAAQKRFLRLKWRWTQGMQRTGGGGPARVPNLRVCEHFIAGVAHAGEKGDLTSCRGTVSSAWQKSPGRRNEEDRAARKGKWSPRGTGTTVLAYPCPTASRYRWQ